MSAEPATLGSYSSLAAFYEADPRRRGAEIDFGAWWFDDGHPMRPRWRVAWCRGTGEVYAFRAYNERVDVLARIEEETAVREALDGWEDVCGFDPADLAWARARLLRKESR